MQSRYSSAIVSYCDQEGIAVPAGFHVHPASPLAVIKVFPDRVQLVARTWFKQADVLYYLNMQARMNTDQTSSPSYRILDFKRRIELQHVGGRLLQLAPF